MSSLNVDLTVYFEPLGMRVSSAEIITNSEPPAPSKTSCNTWIVNKGLQSNIIQSSFIRIAPS